MRAVRRDELISIAPKSVIIFFYNLIKKMEENVRKTWLMNELSRLSNKSKEIESELDSILDK